MQQECTEQEQDWNKAEYGFPQSTVLFRVVVNATKCQSNVEKVDGDNKSKTSEQHVNSFPLARSKSKSAQ